MKEHTELPDGWEFYPWFAKHQELIVKYCELYPCFLNRKIKVRLNEDIFVYIKNGRIWL
jgi:Zn-finger protein